MSLFDFFKSKNSFSEQLINKNNAEGGLSKHLYFEEKKEDKFTSDNTKKVYTFDEFINLIGEEGKKSQEKCEELYEEPPKKEYQPSKSRKIESVRKLLDEINQKMDADLDVEKEIDFISKNKNVLDGWFNTAKEMKAFKHGLKERDREKPKEITLVVKKTYNKRYYIALKLSELAKNVEDGIDAFRMTFDTNSIDDIRLAIGTIDSDCEENAQALQFMADYDYVTKLQSLLWTPNFWVERAYGNAALCVRLNEKIYLPCKRMYDEIYQSMLDEGIVQATWKSEYALYQLVKHYFDDAIFQYRAKWLSQQSLDIFIPSINVAIEYQGKQHYEPIEYFGGKEGYEDSVRRDEIKRKKCASNQVELLYYPYFREVNQKEIEKFFSENNVVFD